MVLAGSADVRFILNFPPDGRAFPVRTPLMFSTDTRLTLAHVRSAAQTTVPTQDQVYSNMRMRKVLCVMRICISIMFRNNDTSTVESINVTHAIVVSCGLNNIIMTLKFRKKLLVQNTSKSLSEGINFENLSGWVRT